MKILKSHEYDIFRGLKKINHAFKIDLKYSANIDILTMYTGWLWPGSGSDLQENTGSSSGRQDNARSESDHRKTTRIRNPVYNTLVAIYINIQKYNNIIF